MRKNILLKKARKKLSLSQRKFAKFLGISKSAYNRYELGRRFPPIEVVKKCCRILNIKLYFRRNDDFKNCYKKIIYFKKKKNICQKLDILRRIKMCYIKKISYRSKLPYWKCCSIFAGKTLPTRNEVTKLSYAIGFSPKVLRKEVFRKVLQKYIQIFSL